MPWRHPELRRRSEPQVSGKVRHSASWRGVARGPPRCLGCIRLPPLIYFLHLEIAPDLASSGDPRLGHEKVRKTEGLWGEREQRIRASETGRAAFKAHPAHSERVRHVLRGREAPAAPGAGATEPTNPEPGDLPSPRAADPAAARLRRAGGEAASRRAGALGARGEAGGEPVCVGGRLRPRRRWPASPRGEALGPQAADTWSVSGTAAF